MIFITVIIQAAEVILNKYDLRISNRYKLINYEEEDARANLKVGSDHFLEVTVPAVAVMLMGIIFVLLCARYTSLYCITWLKIRRYSNFLQTRERNLSDLCRQGEKWICGRRLIIMTFVNIAKKIFNPKQDFI